MACTTRQTACTASLLPSGEPSRSVSRCKINAAGHSDVGRLHIPNTALNLAGTHLTGPALQELMFFASVGDLKRCTILARTAKQLYGADITDCQDWDARRPL